jgi:hypothetical protein
MKHTPSHSLFTPFRHRLGQNTYNRIFNQLLRRLQEDAKMLWPLGVAEAFGAEPVIPVRRDSGLLCVV